MLTKCLCPQGGFSDYWKGRRDGRPTSPFIPVSEWNQVLKRSGFTSPELNLPDYEDPFRTMNVLVSTATKGPETIERFYPVTLSSFAKSHENKSSGSDAVERQSPLTNGVNGHMSNGIVNGSREPQIDSKPIILVDWLEDPFFPDMTIWLTEMGIRRLILVSSDSGLVEADHEQVLTHVVKLRNLGVDVYFM